MNSGAKLFLTLAGIGGAIGTILLVTTKSAKAAPKLPDQPAPPEVVIAPPAETPEEPPIVVPQPEPEPQIDTAEASRLLLRWWAVEGEALLFSEEDRDKLAARGFPVHFGTEPDDLGASWGPRKRDVAAAFERLNGLSPDDGAPTQKLFDALVRWAKSQEMLPPIPPKSATEPAPQIILPTTPTEPPIVVAPEPEAPAPPAAGPPPFVPPLPAAAPAALPLPVALPVSLPPVLPGVLPALAAVLPAVLPAVEPPAPVVATPAAVQPALVAPETAALVAELLAAESSPTWKRKYKSVGVWQKSRGLKVDEMFGPKSALAVAKEIGTVPIVRYWPAGSNPVKVVPQFKLDLLELAKQAEEPRRAQLLISAKRERGQAFDAKQTALPEFERVQLTQVA
jgi:hypothetical protein